MRSSLPSNYFDVVIARFVFQHLSYPERALKEIGIGGTSNLQANTPVQTGNLRRSLTFKEAKRDKCYSILFGSSLDYAPYTTLRPNISTHGWFQNSIRDYSNNAIDIISRHLKEVGR